MIEFIFTWLGALAVLVAIIGAAIKIANEYERGVIFRLGRFAGIKGPGLFFIIPVVDRVEKIDLRIITHDVPAQDVITRDNVPIKVDAVLYYKVTDPQKAVIDVEDFRKATAQIALTSLRGVVGSSMLDELLSEREAIDKKLHESIDIATDPWGIRVTAVEVKHVEINPNMQRAIARQAEAERIKRAKIILADGEQLAAAKLKEAGEILNATPITLRYLQTLADAAKEPNTTILFPAEMLGMLGKLQEYTK
jgi:regulator of protease activity HflC (stomatin/prohibitin superfamily)